MGAYGYCYPAGYTRQEGYSASTISIVAQSYCLKAAYFLFQVSNKFRLLEIRMGFNLIDCRWDLGSLEELLYLFDGTIAHSDAPDLSCRDKLFESCPCVADGNVCQPESLRHWVDRGKRLVGVLKRHGPMYLQQSEGEPVIGFLPIAYQI